jgi:hypothetical protein
MSLNVMYGFREGWNGLRRARLATVVTVSTVALMLFLLGAFVLVTVNVRQIVGTFKSKMSFEVFIDNSLNESQINALHQKLLLTAGVQDAKFITKEEALNRFQLEYGDELASGGCGRSRVPRQTFQGGGSMEQGCDDRGFGSFNSCFFGHTASGGKHTSIDHIRPI